MQRILVRALVAAPCGAERRPGAGRDARVAGGADGEARLHGQDPDHDERLQAARAGHQDARCRRTPHWGGGPHVLLVLDTREYKGKTWLRVRAARPPERLERLDPRGFRPPQRRPSWRVTVNRATHLVTVYRNGRKQRSFRSVIGAPATPTPRGLYAIYEKLAQPEPEGLPRPLGAAPDGVLERAASTTAAGLAAWRSTAATARA